ncbi:hypothetical protein LPTSP3_g31110 [Leptospira kobayashii]|uniref:Antitoxin SocA-like Panacea domain-containing protein n=1 Tax=Leptospira kobayashii TaxID=1917830 RepID=A0ABM7UMB2_9LEPT|nr:type II toxin-antitoxin system antitoxin SocA domain-containing protein [Leptospira kobayashii]BDA80181.1 hypothetical protein LPTSP3_g31110 [Leptospira kobayashii]
MIGMKAGSKIDSKIAFLISFFPNKRIAITHLVKLLYALELKSIAEKKRRFSQLKFIHDHYGPNIPEIESILSSSFFEVQFDEDQKYYYSNFKSNTKETKFSTEEAKFIEEFALEFREYRFSGKGDPRNAGGLLGYAYNTEPFIETKFKEEINFEKYIGNSFIDKVLIKDKDFERYKTQALKLSEFITPLFTQEARNKMRTRLSKIKNK